MIYNFNRPLSFCMGEQLCFVHDSIVINPPIAYQKQGLGPQKPMMVMMFTVVMMIS